MNYVYYLAWRTNSSGGNLDWLEYTVNSNNGQFVRDPEDLGPDNVPATFYVAVATDIKNTTTMQLTECTLFNTSYIFNVTNQNGIQAYLPIQSEALSAVDTLSNFDASWTFESNRTVCSYLSVMASFYDVIRGVIGTGETMEAILPTITTSILSTTLTSTLELNPVLSLVDAQSSSEVDIEPPGNMTLRQGLEDMFLNTVLSMMSSTRFRTNFTQHPDMLTNVTSSSPYIVYAYRPEILGLVYVSAGAITAVLVAFGIAVVVGSNGSYSNYFSTVMRATRGQYVDSLMEPLDMDGKDPLPDYLADAKLKLQDQSSGGFADYNRLHREEY